MNRIFTLLLACAISLPLVSQNLVTDGGFEAGAASGWVQTSTNFGTPLCDASNCGTCGGPCVANSGSWYAWFGGADTAEIGTLSQNVTIPNASVATLTFWVKIPIAQDTVADSLKLLVNGSNVWGVSAIDSAAYQTDYVEETIDMSAHIGSTVSLEFIGNETEGNAGVTNMLLDDVELTTSFGVGVYENLLGPNAVAVYPNPASDLLNINIRLAEPRDFTLEMVAMDGKVVYAEEMAGVTTGTKTLDVSNLASGMYLIQIDSEDGRMIHKVYVGH